MFRVFWASLSRLGIRRGVSQGRWSDCPVRVAGVGRPVRRCYGVVTAPPVSCEVGLTLR